MNAFPLHQSCLASDLTCHLPWHKPSQLLCCMHAQGTQHRALAMVAVALPGGQLMSHEPIAHAKKDARFKPMHACAGYTALGMALALPEGGVVHACDISPEYPAVGAPAMCTNFAGLRERMLDEMLEPL